MCILPAGAGMLMIEAQSISRGPADRIDKALDLVRIFPCPGPENGETDLLIKKRPRHLTEGKNEQSHRPRCKG